jgi:peptidoglycan/LPS O-acetylase OafA/YrhL
MPRRLVSTARGWLSPRGIRDDSEQYTPFLAFGTEDPQVLRSPRDRWFGRFQLLSFHLFTTVLRIAVVLVPSYIPIGKWKPSVPQTRRLSNTAWLDGLRGIAAFFVIIWHFAYAYFNGVDFGYGHPSGDHNRIWQLPIVKLFYSGHPMVAVFFVASGISLSLKPLRLLRSKQWEALLKNLVSSTFRRPMRLFLPCVASTFAVVLMCQMGIYEHTRPWATNAFFRTGWREYHVKTEETMGKQLYHWFWDLVKWSNLWKWDFDNTQYDVHLWTIPVEFRCSLELFVTILGLSRLKPKLRMGLLLLIIYYASIAGRWEVIMFLSGLFLAELIIIQEGSTITARTVTGLTSPIESRDLSTEVEAEKPISVSFHTRHLLLIRTFWLLNFISGLYLMSTPNKDVWRTPGYKQLNRLTPDAYAWDQKHRFLIGLGVVQVMISVSNAQFLQRLFTNPLAQYLGKISFALYLVHGPIYHSWGYTVMPHIWGWTGYGSDKQFALCFAIAFCVIGPVVFWAADLWWRIVDRPSGDFARWVEERFTVDEAT